MGLFPRSVIHAEIRVTRIVILILVRLACSTASGSEAPNLSRLPDRFREFLLAPEWKLQGKAAAMLGPMAICRLVSRDSLRAVYFSRSPTFEGSRQRQGSSPWARIWRLVELREYLSPTSWRLRIIG